MLEGILGWWSGLWLQARERTLTAVIQEKHLLFLCFDLFCTCFWIFFSPSHCTCQFYWHYEIWLSFGVFVFFFPPSITFFIVVINLCLYIGLLWFCGSFLSFFLSFFLLFFFLFSFLNFNFEFFKPIIISSFIPLFYFPTVPFHLQLIFNVYKSSSTYI